MEYRPRWHFTPRAGWINDPNGLVYADGVWHVFAQYAPDAVKAGPKHWLHATSRDLITFQEMGIAVPPDEDLGEAYSGSAVTAPGFLGGLNPMVLMLTHHGKHEQQSLLWAEDHQTFVPYQGNPVIANSQLRDFRDPKLVWNEALGGWTAVIAAGDHAAFYFSRDLIHWEQTGAFGGHPGLWGVFECPDLIPLTTQCGTRLWALVASMSRDSASGGSRTHYVLGDFDGRTFREGVTTGAPPVDLGFDSYAGVTFYGAKTPTMMAWASNWAYASRQPTGAWRGQMGFARRLQLKDTPHGPRLAAEPIVPAFTVISAQTDGVSPLPGAHCRIRITAPGAFDLALSAPSGDTFRMGLEGGRFYHDRSAMNNASLFGEGFLSGSSARLGAGPVAMTLILDGCVCEAYADDGLYAATTLLYPQAVFDQLTVAGADSVEISV